MVRNGGLRRNGQSAWWRAVSRSVRTYFTFARINFRSPTWVNHNYCFPVHSLHPVRNKYLFGHRFTRLVRPTYLLGTLSLPWDLYGTYAFWFFKKKRFETFLKKQYPSACFYFPGVFEFLWHCWQSFKVLKKHPSLIFIKTILAVIQIQTTSPQKWFDNYSNVWESLLPPNISRCGPAMSTLPLSTIRSIQFKCIKV